MFGPLGYQEIIIFGAIAVLLFGKNLPEVAKSIGATGTVSDGFCARTIARQNSLGAIATPFGDSQRRGCPTFVASRTRQSLVFETNHATLGDNASPDQSQEW